MKEVILCKYGEIILKGSNKGKFEAALMKEMKKRAKYVGGFSVRYNQSTVYVEPTSDDVTEEDVDEMYAQAKKVFGFASVTRAAVCEKNMEDICKTAREYLPEKLMGKRTFRCEAKRSDKKFPLSSPEIAAEVGGVILSCVPKIKVQLKNPEITVRVEVREKYAYIHAGQERAAGGIPLGTGGRGLLLLSGGIDSPVAGYMMAKRGLYIDALHFESFPYTSERARNKVVTLAEKLTDYTGDMNLFIVPFTTVQEYIRDHGVPELFTILMRRSMMRITEKLARKFGASAIITGESLGQVASQTMAAITATNASVDMPIFRPVIGMDKTEITEIARKIDTFETSILPFEDCCTIFTPPHPKTKPSLEEVIAAEEAMGLEELFRLEDEATAEAEKLRINVQ